MFVFAITEVDGHVRKVFILLGTCKRIKKTLKVVSYKDTAVSIYACNFLGAGG